MSTLTIRLPDDTAERLKALARSRGLSTNKLVEQLSAHALAASFLLPCRQRRNEINKLPFGHLSLSKDLFSAALE